MPEEKVVIVNSVNEVVDVVPRSMMRAKSLLHRSTYIIVRNSKGDILIQKRSPLKDLYPNYFDPTTGGVVQEHESYEENAIRELWEELGIKDVQPKFEFDFYFENDKCKVWGRTFSLNYDGIIKPMDGEVADFFFLGRNELIGFLSQDNVMPDGRMALEKYLKIESSNG